MKPTVPFFILICRNSPEIPVTCKYFLRRTCPIEWLVTSGFSYTEEFFVRRNSLLSGLIFVGPLSGADAVIDEGGIAIGANAVGAGNNFGSIARTWSNS